MIVAPKKIHRLLGKEDRSHVRHRFGFSTPLSQKHINLESELDSRRGLVTLASQALEVIVGKSLAWRVLFHRVVRPIK